MMKNKYIILVCIVFLACGGANSDTQESQEQNPLQVELHHCLNRVFSQIIKPHYKILILGPNYHNTALSSEMGYFLYQNWQQLLADRDRITEVREVGQYGAVSSVFNITEDLYHLDGLVSIQYKELDTQHLSLDFTVKDYITLETIFEKSCSIAVEHLPLKTIIPRDFERFQPYIPFNNPIHSFTMEGNFHLLPHKGYGFNYHAGEKMIFYYQGSQEVFVKVFIAEPDGDILQLFPHFRAWDNIMDDGKIYQLPFNLDYIISKPGIHLIKFTCKTSTYNDYTETYHTQSFLKLGNLFTDDGLWESLSQENGLLETQDHAFYAHP